MGKAQYLAITGALLLFGVLYWGFSTIPPASVKAEQAAETTGQGQNIEFSRIVLAAKSALSPEQSSGIEASEKSLENTADEKNRIELLKGLSAQWFDLGQLPAAAGYAEQVAELEKTDSAWSVAGALFFNSLSGAHDAALRDYCAQHAVSAFEKAFALNPGQPEHQVNLALVYAENPPADNPMKAVLLLRDLEKQYPDNPSVYNALGRLAIKTGQWDRAIERLEKAISLDPQNPNTPCLLARAYQGAGQEAKAAEYAKRCK